MFRKATPAELAHYMTMLAPGLSTDAAMRALWRTCSELAPPRTVEKGQRLKAAVFEQGEAWDLR